MNKKLFKGALVLFASILMAVSCSNNSTGGGNDGNGNGNGNGNGGGSGTEVTTITKAQIKTAAIAGLGGDGEKLTVGASENKITLNPTSVSIETSTDTVTIKIAAQSTDTGLDAPKLDTLNSSIGTLIAAKGSLRTELEKVAIVLDSRATTVTSTGVGGKVATTSAITATLKENSKIEDVTGTFSKVVIVVDVTAGTGSQNWAQS